ncbi:M50 family metallopeptidase [Nocardioides dongxiaopingii]|uniref:M50 family metallopeptidase n=1 Tax=Nocardioides sp. S-1144 TaxID=2582905 RepID=UPI00110E92C9|nr:M50 family metallopeptidase [Nocardioides sp. S-1144]QCW49904.1 M50 family metallopeptidase [Nocardioides sp. S-1144]
MEIWDRASAVQPVPEPGLVLLTGVVALALVLLPATWPHVRLGVTVVHEAGHAVVAVLVGRRLQGIRLHADTSGVTVSRGRPSGPGMVATVAAGYLAPAAVGVGAALLLAAGRGVAMLWLLLLLLLALLVWVRNAYGVAVLVVAGVGVGLLTWYAGPQTQSVAAYLVAWLLLLAAPRPVLELITAGRRRSRTSDPDQLARLTRVPALVWCLLLLAANLAGLGVGTLTLAPDVLDRV